MYSNNLFINKSRYIASYKKVKLKINLLIEIQCSK